MLKTPMTYPAVDSFQKAMREGTHPQASLVEALEHYLEEHRKTILPELRTDIRAYQAQLHQVNFDCHFNSTQEKGPELKALLQAAIIEIAKSRAASPLVDAIESRIVVSKEKAKTIFHEAMALEGKLKQTSMSAKHHDEASGYLQDLLEDLIPTFCQLIIEAKNVRDLEAQFIASFPIPPRHLRNIYHHHTLLCDTFDHLKPVMVEFYRWPNLASQYDIVREYLQDLSENQVPSSVLEALDTLSRAIIRKAYAPVEKKIFRLTEEPEATVSWVFGRAKQFIQRAWADYDRTHLLFALVKRLKDQEQTYLKWGIIRSASMPKNVRESKPLMAHIHCFKYTTDPNCHPDDYVRHQMGLTFVEPRQQQAPSRSAPAGVTPQYAALKAGDTKPEVSKVNGSQAPRLGRG